jgi:hypothetical protein
MIGIQSAAQNNLYKIFNVLAGLRFVFESVGLLEMAPQVGIEPTTCGLTVRRSNRLSY